MNGFTLQSVQGVSFFTCTPIIAELPVLHAFSTRAGGVSDGRYTSLNLGFGSGDARVCVQANRLRFGQTVGFDVDCLVTLRQVHGKRGILIAGGDDPMGVRGTPADALITNQPQVPLGVITADCFPVLLVAPSVPAVAIIHAGRRGTLAQIIRVVSTLMCDRFHVPARSLHAAIGPGIGGCCYEIDAVSAQPFHALYTHRDGIFRPSRPQHVYLDLQRANLLQLQAAGIPPQQIWVANLCTVCHPQWFYSYRREGTRTGRMLNVVMLQPG